MENEIHELPASLEAVIQANADDSDITFSSIDDATKNWLKSLNHIWQLWKKCDGVSKTLTDYFESAPNPYLSTLRILVNTSDFEHMKLNSSLAFTVIEEFEKWLIPHKDAYEQCLTVDLKIATFRLIIKQNNMQFITMVAHTYKFREHKEEFLPIIQQLIGMKKYKEAAQYAIMLQLQSYFENVECLLLPLILQNKLLIVESFLTDCPDMQKILIKYLDNLVSSDSNMRTTLNQVIQQYNIPDLKMSTIEIKPMIKLIARLVKLYNLPPEVCPNLNKKRSEGTLQFLVHKRYVQGTLSTASWREMIQEAVGNDKKLQLDMIRLLINANDAKEGLYWAREFNIPKDKWPWAISYEADNENNGINDGASTSRGEVNAREFSEDSTNYHGLPLPRDSIKVINDSRSFEEFLDTGLKRVNVVGIDSEWKPSFGTRQPELALIQIATETNVYILDVTTMGNGPKELWSELALTLFENKAILKIGFGIAHDMTIIQDSLSALSNIKTYGHGYLDIVQLWKKLQNEYKFVFPHEGDQTKNSLSKLVELCLGEKLNKSDQFSNWEQRPLRESQIIYAALDAYCLLEVYVVIERQCQQLDIPFYDICIELQHIPHKLPKKNKKKPMHKPNMCEAGVLNYGNQQNSQRCRSQQTLKHVQKPRYPNRQEYVENRTYSNNTMHPHITEFPTKPTYLNRSHYTNKTGYVKKVHYESERQENISLNSRQVPAHEWRILCDSTLAKLAVKLRICGCDCVHVLTSNPEISGKVAMRENRVYLTRYQGYLKCAQYMRPNHCYIVSTNTVEDQLREVLTRFNVVVTLRNIFTRCQVCNSDEFVKVPKYLMDKLVQSFVKLVRKNGYCVPSSSSGHCTNQMLDTEVPIIHSDSKDLQHDAYVYNYLQCEDRTWILSTNSINVETCSTKYNIEIKIKKVPVDILKRVQLFYVCEHCGNIYWDGVHLHNALDGIFKDHIVYV